MAGSSSIQQPKTILARSREAGQGCLANELFRLLTQTERSSLIHYFIHRWKFLGVI